MRLVESLSATRVTRRELLKYLATTPGMMGLGAVMAPIMYRLYEQVMFRDINTGETSTSPDHTQTGSNRFAWKHPWLKYVGVAIGGATGGLVIKNNRSVTLD